MSLVLTFPTNAELNTVVQDYVAQTQNFIGAQILPETQAMTQKVRWDERDHDRGMTAPHVMGSDPKTDRRMGSVTREYEPIPFKETDLLKEDEMRVEHYARQNQKQWIYRIYNERDDVISLESIGVKIGLSEIYAQIKFRQAEFASRAVN